MSSNIINAIINLINNPILEIKTYYSNKNRANNSGDALEEYIKDLFSGSFNLTEEERLKKIEENFSYLGNSNNPPDIILKGGDAIEVKKIESKDSALALNSSYPKHKLSSESTMISNSCRNCENWKEKDIIYIVGVVNNSKLNSLCMVYGTEFCASQECYERVKNTIKEIIVTIPSIEFSETKELGRVNKVDPLGITYLRVRGMWGIENPWKVFEYIYKKDIQKEFNFMCLINSKKWEEFSNTVDLINLMKLNSNLDVKNVKVKDPNNPATFIDSKLITFSK